MKDRRLGLMVVGAAAITALTVAEPKDEPSWTDEARASATHVHMESNLERCMLDEVAIAMQPTVQPAREQAC